jgi:oligopeptide/dipeptide ABC transporter ATP-binding protein
LRLVSSVDEQSLGALPLDEKVQETWVAGDAESGSFPPLAREGPDEARTTAVGEVPLLEVRGLGRVFVTRGPLGPARRVVAAENVCFRVERGEAVALVGESGSGKSTIARLLVRLDQPDSGKILLDGVDVLAREPGRASLAYRGRVQMIFQDPFGSLNPVHSIAHHLARPLLRHGRALNPTHTVAEHIEPTLRRFGSATRILLRRRAIDLLRTVGLLPAEDFIDRLPFELSGGQRQRVAIARVLAVEPDLLVADEPTSMLDVSIRTGVLNLLAQLKRERGLAIILITHDLAAARYLADRILVLYRGRVVEDGPSRALVESPAHPYTKALLASIAGGPAVGGARRRPASDDAATAGCPFAPRCADVLERCRSNDPSPRSIGAGHRVRCHLYPENAATPGS